MSDILQVQGINEKGFGIIPKLVMQDKRLTPQAKAIYAYFCSYAGAGRTAFPSRKKIISDLSMSINTYYAHFKLLKKHGYIKTEQEKERGGVFQRNIYTLMDSVPCTNISDTESPCINFRDTKNWDTKNCDTNNNSIKNQQSLKSSSQVQSEEPGGQDTDENAIQRTVEMIQDIIDYGNLIAAYERDWPLIDELVTIILDTVLSTAHTVRIGGEDKPRALVSRSLLQLTYEDIEHVITQYKGVTERISRKKQYLLTMLYNAKMERQAHLTNTLPPQYR